MNFRILGAVLRKDVLSLAPIVALSALLFLADPLIERLDLIFEWPMYRVALILITLVVLTMSVFQLDSAASLTDDWLCRPVDKHVLIGAKLLLLLGVVYLPRAIGTFIADLILGFSVTEAFLDAVLLQDRVTLFELPLILFGAIVTRTFVQGFGVLLAICICVFVLPSPFVRPPGPLTLGIRHELLHAGMQWLAATPAMLAAIVLTAVGFWLTYWRRRIAAARMLMAATVCTMLLILLLPMEFVPWNKTFAIQTAFGPTPAADTARISLRNLRTCFPAARRADLSSDAAFVAATQRQGLELWDAEQLGKIGPNSIAFLTDVQPRGLPTDWRVKLNHVQANYSVAGEMLYSLRPAEFITGGGGESLTHAWMLPESAVQTLRGVGPQLELAYSLTLLKPREYSVPTDGQRHTLPGLGYCSAEVDEPGNRIEVDCFSAFSYPAQISAALNDIPASRVYSRSITYGHHLVELAPAFMRWPYSQRLKVSIRSPRLARHDSITVTAWDVAGHFQKSLTVPGILGADLQTCPLPMENNRFQKANWRDAAPHEANSISVDGGVQLEVLDFGGPGSPHGLPILLLPGMGATAHSYDELAPLLAQKHRVVAMTRRGSGASSKPDFGFDTPRLAQDVLEVMDAMGLERVTLVGHSIAGEELTWLGGNHPERFSGLVYLDAAYDRSDARDNPKTLRLRETSRFLPPDPPIPPEALLNFDAMTKWQLALGRLRLPEGELIAARSMNNPYLAGTPTIDGRSMQAMEAAVQAPNYRAVKIPALAIYAISDPDEALAPWYDANDQELMATLAERSRIRNAMQRENIELFRNNVEQGQVLEMQKARHYIIQSNQQEVLEAIEAFVATAR
jgi:non-heme chloroperoxidase